MIIQESHCVTTATGLGGDTGDSASFADLVIQLREQRKTKSTAALPTEAVNKVGMFLTKLISYWSALLPWQNQTINHVILKSPIFKSELLFWLSTFRIFRGNLVPQIRRFQLTQSTKMFCCKVLIMFTRKINRRYKEAKRLNLGDNLYSWMKYILHYRILSMSIHYARIQIFFHSTQTNPLLHLFLYAEGTMPNLCGTSTLQQLMPSISAEKKIRGWRVGTL